VAPTFWNAVLRLIWCECHTSDNSQTPPKQSTVCSTCNTSATRKLSVYLTVSALCMSALSWGDSRPYAVLQRTLDKDCMQAEEPKQLADEASRFHLGRKCQYSVVIYCGALLFSSRVLRPSLVSLCSHKSGWCAVNSTMRLISGTVRSTPLSWLPVLSNI